jgi:hypothetical protein
MQYIRYFYENGLDIITPVKHGTRWLEEKTNPIQILGGPLYEENLIKTPITQNTYWVYRNSREHLISALKTEIRTSIEFGEDETERIVNLYLKNKGHHWSGNALFNLYKYWKEYSVIPIKLSEISSLFDPNLEFIRTEYEMRTYIKTDYDDNLFIINKVGKDRMELLYKMADDDSLWLEKVFNGEK